MNIKQVLTNFIVERGIKMATEKRINAEANARSGGGTSFLSKLKKSANTTKSVELRDWKTALQAAENPEAPDRIRLYNMYDSIMLDNHLTSVIDSRVLRAVHSKFVLKDKTSGEINEDATKLLKKKWFTTFVKLSMMSVFRGSRLIEVLEKNEQGEIKDVNLVPERHVKTDKGVVTIQQGDEDGINYRSGRLVDYYLQVGKDDDIGVLSNVAPMVIFKKHAVGLWSEYMERLGIPPRAVRTTSTDKKRLDELAEAMDNMISASWIVLQGDEEIVFPTFQGSGNPFAVFQEFIKTLNSEISKRVLGQDGTSDNKDATGTYGSLQVLQEVAEDRHKSDKVFVASLVNDNLLPMLAKQGGAYVGFDKLEFEWDEFNELSAKEYIDAVVRLSTSYHIDVDEITKKTGITILGEKQTSNPQTEPEGGEGEKK